MSWNEHILNRSVSLDHHGYSGLQPLFNLIRQNKGFYSIITKKPTTILLRHAAMFFYTVKAKEIKSKKPDDLSPKRYDPLTAEFKILTVDVPNKHIRLLPLILKAYGLKNEGKICWVDDVPEDLIRETYKEVVVIP